AVKDLLLAGIQRVVYPRHIAKPAYLFVVEPGPEKTGEADVVIPHGFGNGRVRAVGNKIVDVAQLLPILPTPARSVILAVRIAKRETAERVGSPEIDQRLLDNRLISGAGQQVVKG